MKQIFKNKPILIGDKVIIRPFSDDDCDVILKIISEPILKKLTGSVSSDEEAYMELQSDEKEEIVKWYKTRNVQEDRLDLAVVNKETDEVIGEVVFNEYDKASKNVNFRILLSESNCNKGMGTEAVSLFVKYGMEELDLHKICLEVYSFNPRAEKVYQKAGFKLEGIKREDFLYNGEYIDTKIYGLLKTQY